MRAMGVGIILFLLFHECVHSESATHRTPGLVCTLLVCHISIKSLLIKMFPELVEGDNPRVHQLKNGHTRCGDSGMLLGSGRQEVLARTTTGTRKLYAIPRPPAVWVHPHELCEEANPEMESRFLGAWGAEWGVPADGDGVSVWGNDKF